MSDIERTEFNLPEGVDAAHATQRNSDVDATAHSEEHDIERSLRPKSLEEFIGQPKVRGGSPPPFFFFFFFFAT